MDGMRVVKSVPQIFFEANRIWKPDINGVWKY